MEQENATTNIIHRKSRLLISLAIIFVILIAASVGLHFKPSKGTPGIPKENGPHQQTLSSLVSYRLAGSVAGTGVSFLHPAQYKLAPTTAAKDQVSFADSISHNQEVDFLGAIHVASSAAGSTTNLQSRYKSALNDPKSGSYQATFKQIEQFLSQRFSPLYTIKYSTARPFNSTKINSSAWAIDISASPKPKMPAAFENYKGEIIFVVGRHGFYYFAAYNTSYNWDNNQAVWNKVLASLDIDQ